RDLTVTGVQTCALPISSDPEVCLADMSRSSDSSNFDARSKVLAATDIVQLIGQTVALKRRGKDHVGLCPFHQEKTPSFHVDAGKIGRASCRERVERGGG